MSRGSRPFFFAVLALSLCSAALASRSVTLEWESIPGAVRYEIEISGEKGEVLREVVPAEKLSWSGDLPFGRYQYRIRSVNQHDRSGPWSEANVVTVRPGPFHSEVGLGAGLNYYYFLAQFETSVSPDISLGLLPTYLSNVEYYTRVNSYGIFLTADYTFSDLQYYGFSARLGAGGYYTTEPYYSLSAFQAAVQAQFLYRRPLRYGIDLALGMGAQYIAPSSLDPSRWVVSYSGVLPLLTLTIGFNL